MDVAIDLPKRPGPRPLTTREFPHSQLDQQPSDPAPLEELLLRALSLPHVIERPSLISVPGARGLFIDEQVAVGPPLAFLRDREFAHFHPGPDWSLHLALPDATADTAIASGWAELHLIARTQQLPGSVVMAYAPRDAAEVDAVWTLLRASYEFALS